MQTGLVGDHSREVGLPGIDGVAPGSESLAARLCGVVPVGDGEALSAVAESEANIANVRVCAVFRQQGGHELLVGLLESGLNEIVGDLLVSVLRVAGYVVRGPERGPDVGGNGAVSGGIGDAIGAGVGGVVAVGPDDQVDHFAGGRPGGDEGIKRGPAVLRIRGWATIDDAPLDGEIASRD